MPPTASSCELLAFILYLCSLKQRLNCGCSSVFCCELLAFILYLCSLKQRSLTLFISVTVVNCLHLSCIFALWNNQDINFPLGSVLWIACIYLVSLLFETTTRAGGFSRTRCELLAFILYLCSLKQRHDETHHQRVVVNCLHLSCIFALWNNIFLVNSVPIVVVNCLHLSCIFALWNNNQNH